MRLAYIIGLPGSGKSTALKRALLSLGHFVGEEFEQPVPHISWLKPHPSQYDERIVELGRRRESFSGTDALALNIQPKATEWLATKPHPLIVAEGDRLANPSFFAAAEQFTDRFDVVLIDVPADVARRRARRRAEDLNRPEQNDSWWKGRATKVANLRALRGDRLTVIDGTAGPTAVAAALAAALAD